MNPTVQSAWVAAASGLVGVLVGVGGTTFVAIKGFRNTRDATQQALNARRDDRLWAKKADAYQDAMTAALQRHDVRQQVLDAEAPPEALKSQVSEEWFYMQGRLRTFGAPKVVTAFEHSMKASERLPDVHQDDTIALTEEFTQDLHKAMDADEALVWAIRCDLGIEPVDTKPNATLSVLTEGS
jgi:hypothetical protein